MSDKFWASLFAAAIISGGAAIYNTSKENKEKKKKQNKVYYGVVRMILLYLAALMSADFILMLILGDSIDGSEAFAMVFVFSIAIFLGYLMLYTKIEEDKLKNKK